MWGGGRAAPAGVKYVPKPGAGRTAPANTVAAPQAAPPIATPSVAPAAAAPAPVAAPLAAPAPAAAGGAFTLWTVGYGGMSGSAAFVDLLRSHNINFLWDIRVSPYSGMKQFNTNSLKETLERAGIQYTHALEMGNVWKAADNDFDAPGRLSLYEELIVLAGELLTRRLREVVQSGKGNVAIMCACGKHKDCHRGVVAAHLEQHFKYRIVHINNSPGHCG